DLLDAVRRRGIEAVGADLPAWLSESASAGGDDVTVVVVARSAPRDRQDARQGSTTASKRAVPIITGAVLIVGVAAGWAFGRATAPDAKSAPPNRSAARTTRTTPRPSTAAQQSASRSATIATPSGITIAFNPTPANPQPRVITHTDAPVVITRLTAGGSTWSIDAGALRRTDSSGTESTVSLDGINPAALMASRDLLWVVDDAATVLAVVDPHTGALTGRADVVDPTSSLAHDLQTVSSTIPVAGSTVGTGRSQP
ncbi:MAG TPA: hypothetical protein VFR41_15385, partial [Acidimicrobiia bacterium]|nr:hypothetical protein [Acidimicrobiia bacterium]